MKIHKRLFIVFILMQSILLVAQDDSNNIELSGLPNDQSFKKFRFGLNFNPLMSWIKPDNKYLKDTGNELGFTYGLMTDFSFSPNYSISTGVQINNIGGNVSQPYVLTKNNSFYQATKETEYKFKRIEIPVTFKLRTNAIGWLVYYGKFGLSTNFRFQAKSDNILTATVNGEQVVDTDNKVDEIKNTALVGLAMIIGGGVEYNISGNTNLMVGLTFHNGFTNIFDYTMLELDKNGKVDISGNAIQSGEKAKGIMNYVSLDLGVFF
jgi:hypothetical protein